MALVHVSRGMAQAVRGVTLGLFLALPATAQQAVNPEQLAAQAVVSFEEAAAALDRAQDQSASTRIVALTQAIRAYETGLAALRAGQRDAALRVQTLESVFDARREYVAELLAVLTAIERAPRPAMVLHPLGPMAGARAGMLLSEITPALGQDVAAMRVALEELQTMRAIQRGAAARLQEGLSGMQEARQRLSQAVADRGPLPVPVAQNPAAMQKLLQSADTLDSFAQGLAAIPAAAPPQDAASGLMPWPVRGLLLRGFWEIDSVGIARPGWLIGTEPGALVTAPASATVRYVGPLLDFGAVVVLEPAPAALMILAGLGVTYVQTGEVVPTGTPLGLMPGAQGSQAEVSGASVGETLYMEVRLGDQPVNPTDYFAPNGAPSGG